MCVDHHRDLVCECASSRSRGFIRDACVWDYVKDDEAAAGIYSWSLTGRVNLKNFDSRFGNKVYLLALDPNDGDFLYLELSQHIAMFNCAARTLTEAWKTKLSCDTRAERGIVFPFVLLWRPTPVPGHEPRERPCSSNSRLQH